MITLQDLIGKNTNPYSAAYSLIRMFLGGALFVRGALFMTNQSSIIEVVEQQGMDWVFPMMGIHYVTLAHLCGGFMLAIGLYTRAAAIMQIPVLFGAVFFFHLSEGLFAEGQSLELSVLVLFLLLMISVFGAGAYSFDQTVLAQEGEKEGARKQRIQQSLRVGRERVMEEIRLKKEQALSEGPAAFSGQTTDVSRMSGSAESGRSILNIIYIVSAYGGLLVLIAALFVLKLIQVPQGMSSAIFGGAVVLLLLMSMFYMIYRSAISKES